MWWTLVSYSFSSLLWGLLMALGGVLLVFLLVRVLSPDRRLAPIGYVALGVAFVLLFTQTSLLCGAWRVRSLVNDVEAQATSLLSEGTGILQDNLSQSDASKLISSLVDEYPVLSSYIDSAALVGYTVEQVPHMVGESVRDSIASFIYWRLFWSVLFLVAGALVLALTAKRKNCCGTMYNGEEFSYDSSYDSDYTPDYSYE